MSQLANQWIEIFRAHKGDNGEFTEQDVQRIADNYNPANHEAPIVIGHPKANGPAYGWVAAVRRVGPVLQAKLKDVNGAFEQMVSAKQFKKRSVSLYPDTGNGYSLRHVGFLGAQPPVVKGLADIAFAQVDNAVEIEFSEGDDVAELNATQQQSIVDSVLAGIKGLWPSRTAPAEMHAAPKNFSEAEITSLVTLAVTAAVKPLSERLAAQDLKFSERENAAKTTESKQRASEAILRVKQKGVWVPAFDKLALPLVFAELATRVETIEFGEGENKKKETPLEIFTNFMESFGKIVPEMTIDVARRTAAKPAVGRVNDGGRVQADNNSIQFAEAINAYREAHPNVSYEAAMESVARKNPELTVAGGVAAGAV